MGDLMAIGLLWLVYVALTGSAAPANLALGLVVAALAWHLTPVHPRAPRARSLPGAAVAVARYVVVVASDVIAGGLQVVRIVLSPRLRLRPGIIPIPSGCRSELATALSAHAITLSPGEVVVEIAPDGTLYTHCLDVTRSARYVAEAQRLRRDLLSRIVPDRPPSEAGR